MQPPLTSTPPARHEGRIILTADDFGWTDGQNLAIERAAQAGTLTRASLLCNGDAFAGALLIAQRCPQLEVGVHLTLCEGRPVGRGVGLSQLLRSDGAFHDGLRPLCQTYLRGQLDVNAIRDEWRQQIERALRAGFQLSHLDGHKHVHMLPPLQQLAIKLAQEYQVGYVRTSAEILSRRALTRAPVWLVLFCLGTYARHHVRAAGLRTCDRFVGLTDSGQMTAEKLLDAIQEARKHRGTTEIMLHPAVLTPEMLQLGHRYAWARSYQFEGELSALCDPRVIAALKQPPAATSASLAA